MKRYNPYKRLTQDELKYVVGGPRGTYTANPPPQPTATYNPGRFLPAQACAAAAHLPEQAAIQPPQACYGTVFS